MQNSPWHLAQATSVVSNGQATVPAKLDVNKATWLKPAHSTTQPVSV